MREKILYYNIRTNSSHEHRRNNVTRYNIVPGEQLKIFRSRLKHFSIPFQESGMFFFCRNDTINNPLERYVVVTCRVNTRAVWYFFTKTVVTRRGHLYINKLNSTARVDLFAICVCPPRVITYVNKHYIRATALLQNTVQTFPSARLLFFRFPYRNQIIKIISFIVFRHNIKISSFNANARRYTDRASECVRQTLKFDKGSWRFCTRGTIIL